MKQTALAFLLIVILSLLLAGAAAAGTADIDPGGITRFVDIDYHDRMWVYCAGGSENAQVEIIPAGSVIYLRCLPSDNPTLPDPVQ